MGRFLDGIQIKELAAENVKLKDEKEELLNSLADAAKLLRDTLPVLKGESFMVERIRFEQMASMFEMLIYRMRSLEAMRCQRNTSDSGN